MRAGEFAAGSALLVPREIRHDRQTARSLARFRNHLAAGTDDDVIVAAAALERPEASRHPLCAEYRQIVDAAAAARHLSLAPLAGGAK